MSRSVTIQFGGNLAGRWIRWNLAKIRGFAGMAPRSEIEMLALLADAVIESNLVDVAGSPLDLRDVQGWEDLPSAAMAQIYETLTSSTTPAWTLRRN